MRVLAQGASDRFRMELERYSREMYPTEHEDWGVTQKAFIEAALRAGEQFGIETLQCHARILNLLHVWGPDAIDERDPEWLARLLADRAMTPEERLADAELQTQMEIEREGRRG